MSTPNKFAPQNNVDPKILLNMGVSKVQVGEQFVVVLSFAIGTLTNQVLIPAAEARALAREISKYADECGTAIVQPQSGLNLA